MTDQNDAIEAVEPEPVEVVDAAPQAEPVEEVQPDPIERLAQKAGWTPKDQWRGAEDQWKPADQYLEGTIDIKTSLSKDVKSLKTQMDRMARTSASIMQQQLAERDAYWQQQHARAVEEGDTRAALDAARQLDGIQRERVEAITPPSEVAEFQARNPWLGTHQAATSFAAQRGDYYAQLGYSVQQQLEAVEREVRAAYPDLAGTPAPKPAAKPQPAVAPPTRTVGRARGTTFADMPAAAQAQARHFQETAGVPLEEYTQRYFADQEKNR